MYLIDTTVITAARHPDRSANLAAWLDGQAESSLFVSVITLGELARGIVQIEEKAPHFANDLRAWLSRTETLFADRVLPFDTPAARIWAELSARTAHPGAALMIAATALATGATVVTENAAGFAPTGARVINPFNA